MIFIIYLFVCIATNRGEVTRNLKLQLLRYLELYKKASCALDHFSLSNNVIYNHHDMLRLI
jgi:hypothetical protein